MFTMLLCDDPGIVLVGYEVEFILQGLPDLDQFILKWSIGRGLILNWFKLGNTSQEPASMDRLTCANGWNTSSHMDAHAIIMY